MDQWTSLHPRLVSIVSTRTPSEDGIREAQAVSKMLADEGVTMVSGLAAGIDTVAHRTAIDVGGRTVAVLGTLLDTQCPKSNCGLQNEIAAGHLVVSQFPAGHPINRGNFVRRNKTMALLADATVIVEAGDGSGTIHQGWEVLRMGKPLLVCSPAARARPGWLDEMKRYGAAVLTDHRHILDEIPLGIKVADVFAEQTC